MGGSGEKMITINQETQIPVMGDDSVLVSLSQNKVFFTIGLRRQGDVRNV
jgi:Na+-transporting NADH:ubiquinone oxidoreductase subunit F